MLLKTRGGDPQLVSCKVAGRSHDVQSVTKITCPPWEANYSKGSITSWIEKTASAARICRILVTWAQTLFSASYKEGPTEPLQKPVSEHNQHDIKAAHPPKPPARGLEQGDGGQQ